MDLLSPVFIIGVPRSGTTLLRVILDSHSTIAAAPETPWIIGSYGANSIKHLTGFLIESDYGPVKNLPGVTSDTILKAMRLFVHEIFSAYLEKKHKKILVLKTPNDIEFIDFMLGLYPKSKYIHIVRDGRDVSSSMAENACSLISDEIDGYGKRNHLNSMRRWYDWEKKARYYFDKHRVEPVSLKYEDLVSCPLETVKKVCNGLGVEFEPDMLNYNRHSHELPDWEAGTYDLKKKKKDIDTASIGRWKQRFTKDEIQKVEKEYGDFLRFLGYSN